LIAVTMLGMCYALLGSLKLALAERLEINEDKVGGLVAAFGFMVGPVILLCGFLTDKFGPQDIWFVGAVLVGISLMLLARIQTYRGAVVAVLILGSGWAMMVNVSNVLGSIVFAPNLVSGMSYIDFVFGLGAFMMPMTVAWLLARMKFQGMVTLFGTVTVVPALCILFVSLEPSKATAKAGDHNQTQTQTVGENNATKAPGEKADAAQEKSPDRIDTFEEMLRSPVLWLCCLTMLFYAPLELSLGAWATTLVKRQIPEDMSADQSAKLTTLALSGFWLCFLSARLLSAIFGNDSIGHGLHVVLAVLGTAGLLGIVYSRKRQQTIALVMFCGFVFGPVFPVLIAILLKPMATEVSGRAVGFLFAGASIGWTLIPPLIGWVAKRTNLQRGFLVAVASSVIFLGLVIAHYIYHTQ
jgi:MFS family permease